MQQLQVLTHFNFCRHHTLHLSVIILPSECWLYTIEKKIDKREGTDNWKEITNMHLSIIERPQSYPFVLQLM